MMHPPLSSKGIRGCGTCFKEAATTATQADRKIKLQQRDGNAFNDAVNNILPVQDGRMSDGTGREGNAEVVKVAYNGVVDMGEKRGLMLVDDSKVSGGEVRCGVV
jgi:hypothetical protein